MSLLCTVSDSCKYEAYRGREVWLHSMASSDLATVVKDQSGSLFMFLAFAPTHVLLSFLLAAP